MPCEEGETHVLQLSGKRDLLGIGTLNLMGRVPDYE